MTEQSCCADRHADMLLKGILAAPERMLEIDTTLTMECIVSSTNLKTWHEDSAQVSGFRELKSLT